MVTEIKYQKLYESLKDGVAAMEKQIAELKQQVTVLQAEKNQWQLEKVVQQQIIQKALANSNETSNTYLEENKRLKEALGRHHCAGCDGSDNWDGVTKKS